MNKKRKDEVNNKMSSMSFEIQLSGVDEACQDYGVCTETRKSSLKEKKVVVMGHVMA